eukprot:816139-Pyramimonas_sp.AAC.1
MTTGCPLRGRRGTNQRLSQQRTKGAECPPPGEGRPGGAERCAVSDPPALGLDTQQYGVRKQVAGESNSQVVRWLSISTGRCDPGKSREAVRYAAIACGRQPVNQKQGQSQGGKGAAEA